MTSPGDVMPVLLFPLVVREVLRNWALIEIRVARCDVVNPFRRYACVIDDESSSVGGGLEREANDRVHARLPRRVMLHPESPRLHDALPWQDLDLPAFDPPAEERERLTFA